MLLKKLLEFCRKNKHHIGISLTLSDDSSNELKLFFSPLKLSEDEFKVRVMDCDDCEILEDILVDCNKSHPLIKYFPNNHLRAVIEGYLIEKNDKGKFNCYLKLKSPDMYILNKSFKEFFNCGQCNEIKLEMLIHNDFKQPYLKILERLKGNELYFDGIIFEKLDKEPLKSIFDKVKGK